MRSDKISYAGIAGAVGGIVALLGIYAGWWSVGDTSYDGVEDISGGLALAMAIGTFAFGGAYVLMADPKIRRALGALMTICAVVLTLACIWGLTRGDQVAADTDVKAGLWISVLGGVIGILAGMFALRDAMAMDASETMASGGSEMPSGGMSMPADTSMPSEPSMPAETSRPSDPTMPSDPSMGKPADPDEPPRSDTSS
jgi:hypothetical protein